MKFYTLGELEELENLQKESFSESFSENQTFSPLDMDYMDSLASQLEEFFRIEWSIVDEEVFYVAIDNVCISYDEDLSILFDVRWTIKENISGYKKGIYLPSYLYKGTKKEIACFIMGMLGDDY